MFMKLFTSLVGICIKQIHFLSFFLSGRMADTKAKR